MRIVSLSLLLATVSLIALPATAQDAKPPVVTAPATEAAPPRPAVVMMAPPAPEPPAAIPEVWAPVPTDGEGRSAYGLYLSARLALSRGDQAAAADFLRATEALTPEQPIVREAAFMAAVFGGDLDFAAEMTPAGEGVSPALTQTGRLIEVVQAFVHGDPAAALAVYAQAPIGQPNARAADFLRPFLEAGAGNREAALALPNLMPNDPALLLSRYHRAILLEHYGDLEAADKEFAALMTSRGGAPARARRCSACPTVSSWSAATAGPRPSPCMTPPSPTTPPTPVSLRLAPAQPSAAARPRPSPCVRGRPSP